MEKFRTSEEVNLAGRPYQEFVYEGDEGDPIPHPKMMGGATPLAYRFILSAAQHNVAMSPRDVAFNIGSGTGIVQQAYNMLRKHGWELNHVPTGRHSRENYVELVHFDGVEPQKFRMLDLEFSFETPPEDWDAPRTDGDAPQRKSQRGFTPPPFGVPVQITKLELVHERIELTLARKWSGVLDKTVLLRIGDSVEIIGAGIAEDGPWLNTTQFTLRKVK